MLSSNSRSVEEAKQGVNLQDWSFSIDLFYQHKICEKESKLGTHVYRMLSTGKQTIKNQSFIGLNPFTENVCSFCTENLSRQ